MGSLWFTSILFIKVNKVLEYDSQSSPPFPFFLPSIQQRSLMLKSHSLNCGRKEIVQRPGLGGRSKEGIQVENTYRERWEGQKRRQTCQSKLCQFKHFPGICYEPRNREESLFLHFLFHTSNLITDCMAQCPQGSRN